jgi:hypothetical protein
VPHHDYSLEVRFLEVWLSVRIVGHPETIALNSSKNFQPHAKSKLECDTNHLRPSS